MVGLVLFDDHDQAENADRRINLLRPELGLAQEFEFGFHRCRPDVRQYFLTQMLPYRWFYLAIAINKGCHSRGTATRLSRTRGASGRARSPRPGARERRIGGISGGPGRARGETSEHRPHWRSRWVGRISLPW